MSTPVEQIKSRLNIVDIVGGYVRLQKAGSTYKALCPFHQEKSPSFTVSPTRQAYHCFGCNKGGDMFSFIEEIEGLDFPGALKVLAEKAGVELKKEDRKVTSQRERLYSVMETATRYFVSRLTPEHPAYAYLTGRGLTQETITRFRIGFAPEAASWRPLADALGERGIKDDELERVGLSKQGERGGYYDRFRSRVMFPICDASGRVIAFSGRIFGNAPDDIAKYINSPETPLYDKSVALFGFDKAKVAIRKQNFCVIVEGQMDLVMAHQAGTENTIAVSGTVINAKKANTYAKWNVTPEEIEKFMSAMREGLDPVTGVKVSKIGFLGNPLNYGVVTPNISDLVLRSDGTSPIPPEKDFHEYRGYREALLEEVYALAAATRDDGWFEDDTPGIPKEKFAKAIEFLYMLPESEGHGYLPQGVTASPDGVVTFWWKHHKKKVTFAITNFGIDSWLLEYQGNFPQDNSNRFLTLRPGAIEYLVIELKKMYS
jgi:DNA primase catalytic core